MSESVAIDLNKARDQIVRRGWKFVMACCCRHAVLVCSREVAGDKIGTLCAEHGWREIRAS